MSYDTGFYITELPIINNGKRRKRETAQNTQQITYKHGLGCNDWGDCFTCPKSDCDWQPYPKPRKIKGRQP